MAQTGYTPLFIYSSTTAAAAPTVGNLVNGTLGSELAINITDGKLFYKDNANAIQVIGWKVRPATAGGTGLTSFVIGDTLYADSTTTLAKLTIGASGRYLSSSGSAPQWTAPAALTKTDDTNVTLTLGGSASTALLNAASLTLGWTGQLATTRGGTGLSSFTANGVMYASSTSALATGSALTFDGANLATTGNATAKAFIPSSSTVPANGLFLPAANMSGVAANSVEAVRWNGTKQMMLGTTTAPEQASVGCFTFGYRGLEAIVNTSMAASGTLDLTITTETYVGAPGGFAGILVVTSCRSNYTPQSRRVVYSVAAYGTTLVTNQLTLQDGSAGGMTFTLTMPSNGVIRFTETSAAPSEVTMMFMGCKTLT
jgi:hypothetical protein